MSKTNALMNLSNVLTDWYELHAGEFDLITIIYKCYSIVTID